MTVLTLPSGPALSDQRLCDHAFSILCPVLYVNPANVKAHFGTGTLVVPGVMLTRKIGPHWTLPGMMIGWGSMAMMNAACSTFAGVLLIRLLLGAFEAGFAASLIYYLTTFYTRGELAKVCPSGVSCPDLLGISCPDLVFNLWHTTDVIQACSCILLLQRSIWGVLWVSRYH
jgi:hypothetical protein